MPACHKDSGEARSDIAHFETHANSGTLRQAGYHRTIGTRTQGRSQLSEGRAVWDEHKQEEQIDIHLCSVLS